MIESFKLTQKTKTLIMGKRSYREWEIAGIDIPCRYCRQPLRLNSHVIRKVKHGRNINDYFHPSCAQEVGLVS